MTKTENYSLPQWEAGDPVRRTDFNQAMQNIETGLTAASYALGSYTGNGLDLSDGGLHVELGFRPRFVLISKGLASTRALSASTFILTENPNPGVEQFAALDESGFTVGLCEAIETYGFKLNTADNIYNFVAFR